MKNLLILVLILASLSACTKTANTGAGSHGSTTCTCKFVYRPGRDTTIKYSMDPGATITVDSQCRYKDFTIKNNYGNGSCSL